MKRTVGGCNQRQAKVPAEEQDEKEDEKKKEERKGHQC